MLVHIVSLAILFKVLVGNATDQWKNDQEKKYFFEENLDITQPNEPKNTRMNVDRYSFRVWPKAMVPYVISNDYKQREKDVITKAMKNIESVTCVRFRQRTNQKDYLFITPDYRNGHGCYSSVGRQGGKQMLKMQGNCVRDSAMTHELIHAIGFGHENQRPDARKYIKIFKDNINPAYYVSAYQPYSRTFYTTRNKPYDFYSIMHYPDYAYAKSAGLKTMKSINPPGIDLSYERKKMSSADIAMVKLYYNCK